MNETFIDSDVVVVVENRVCLASYQEANQSSQHLGQHESFVNDSFYQTGSTCMTEFQKINFREKSFQK